MPKVAYSEADRAQIRQSLISTALELMAQQGIQHMTVEQIYRAVGISRTFFYSFFRTKEDLIVETLYLQQPRIISYAQSLMADTSLSWKEAVRKFLFTCCYGEKNGIAVMTVEEQQLLFRRLPEESYRVFREKQARLFGNILECFGIRPDTKRVQLFTNLCLASWSSAGPSREHCPCWSRRPRTKPSLSRSTPWWTIWPLCVSPPPIDRFFLSSALAAAAADFSLPQIKTNY